jgi:hypothetical protein
MVKKLVTIFAVLMIAVVVAGTLPPAHTVYKISLDRAAVLNGTAFKAGDCVLTLNFVDQKATFTQGKQSVIVPAKFETVDRKFSVTAVGFMNQRITEIELAGTKTKVTLNP